MKDLIDNIKSEVRAIPRKLYENVAKNFAKEAGCVVNRMALIWNMYSDISFVSGNNYPSYLFNLYTCYTNL